MSPGGQSNLLLIRRLLHSPTPDFDPICGRFFAQVLLKFWFAPDGFCRRPNGFVGHLRGAEAHPCHRTTLGVHVIALLPVSMAMNSDASTARSIARLAMAMARWPRRQQRLPLRALAPKIATWTLRSIGCGSRGIAPQGELIEVRHGVGVAERLRQRVQKLIVRFAQSRARMI